MPSIKYLRYSSGPALRAPCIRITHSAFKRCRELLGNWLDRSVGKMSTPLIRLAREADIGAMVALLAELFAVESDFHFDAGKQRQGLVLLLQHELAEALVAESDGRVVGMCTMQRLLSTAEGGWAGHIEDVVVASGFRGQGIGSQLLAAMERRAAVWGITRLQLLADRNNTAALDFYASRGWLPTELVALRRHCPSGLP